jgi:hypothetical protein
MLSLIDQGLVAALNLYDTERQSSLRSTRQPMMGSVFDWRTSNVLRQE